MEHPNPKARWFNMRVMSYFSLVALISMMLIAAYQGWLKDSVGAFMFAFCTIIGSYMGLSTTADYLVKK